ncbi:MAG TPA: hypothetical protein V6D05_10805 [Stenomitos sp.]
MTSYGMSKDEIIHQVSRILEEQLLGTLTEADLNSPQLIIKLTGVLLGSVASIVEQNNAKLIHDLLEAGLLKSNAE